MRNGSVLLFLSVAALAALCIAAPSGDGGGESYPQGPCDPGTEVSYQCNRCTCTQDGTGYACTRQLCPPPEREKRQAICTPGQRYPAPDGCNTCICAQNGTDLACTLKFCLPPTRERRQARCVPGQRSLDGCNTCTCTSTGVLVCTQRLCITGGPGIGPPLRV